MIAGKILSEVKNKIKKSAWRYTRENLLGIGETKSGKQRRQSLSSKRVVQDLESVQKLGQQKLDRIMKSEFKSLDYIKEMKDLLKLSPKGLSDREAREVLAATADFLIDDAVSVMGLRQQQAQFIREQIDAGFLPKTMSKKQKTKEYFRYQKYVSEFRDKTLQSGKMYDDATKSRAYRFMKWKGVNRMREIGDTEAIRRAMYNWQMMGEPEPNE